MSRILYICIFQKSIINKKEVDKLVEMANYVTKMSNTDLALTIRPMLPFKLYLIIDCYYILLYQPSHSLHWYYEVSTVIIPIVWDTSGTTYNCSAPCSFISAPAEVPTLCRRLFQVSLTLLQPNSASPGAMVCTFFPSVLSDV